MPEVQFTSHLSRFFPELKRESIEAETVRDVVESLDARHPGLASYLLDDQGALRKHVNIFLDGRLISDREKLSDRIEDVQTISIMQALSGG